MSVKTAASAFPFRTLDLPSTLHEKNNNTGIWATIRIRLLFASENEIREVPNNKLQDLPRYLDTLSKTKL